MSPYKFVSIALLGAACSSSRPEPGTAPAPPAASESASGSSSSSESAPASAPASASESESAASASAPASASASAPASAPSGKRAKIEVGEPKFTSGEVPRAKAALEKLAAKKLEACVNDAGGISADRAEIEVQFLVRAAGKAEGVDVLRMKGVPEPAKKCVRDAIQKASVGTPSADPVGVTVVFTLVSI